MKKLLISTIAMLALVSWKAWSPAGTGTVLNMTMTSTRGMTATIKVYHDEPGTRVEMNASMGAYGFSKTSLIRKDDPDKVYQLDAATKTYSVSDVKNSTEKKDGPATATLLGTDSVNGYSCKHVKVVQDDKNWEMWTTTGITEFGQYSAVMNKQHFTGNEALLDALRAIGAEGFPVKTVLTDKEGTTTTTLTGIERKVLDASLFSVPADYKQTSMPAGMPGGFPGRPH